MYTNDKIELLIGATRLYCYNMYQEYDPKFYPTIKNVILGFTNKIFGTKSLENKVDIDIIGIFNHPIENSFGFKVYSGTTVTIELPNESISGVLNKSPLVPVKDVYYYRFPQKYTIQGWINKRP